MTATVSSSLVISLLAATSLSAVAPAASASPATVAGGRSDAGTPSVRPLDLPAGCTGPDSTSTVTCSFDFTGGYQTFTVPAGVDSLFANVVGAQGGNGNGNGSSSGGDSGYQDATVTVTPGEVLTVAVGGQGDGSYSGGAGGWPDGGNGGNVGNVTADGCGGGGSSTLIDGSNAYILVAGGGGGCGGTVGWGAGGGGVGGNDPTGGGDGSGTGGSCHYGGYGGGGGDNPSGGGEGQYLSGFYCYGGGESFAQGQAGGYDFGGNGGQSRDQNGNAGSGGGGGGGTPGGGGGGGAQDQNGLQTGDGGGGGGGGNYASSDQSEVQGAYAGSGTHTGDGIVQLSYQIGSSTTALSADPSSGTVNGPVGLAASVAASSGDADGGTVTISDGGTAIPGCVGLPVTSGIAACTWTPTAVGTHPLTATYSGNAAVTGSSTTSAVDYSVASNPTSLRLDASIASDGSLSATATVTSAAYAPPAGAVSFVATTGEAPGVPVCSSVPTGTGSQLGVAVCDLTASQLAGLDLSAGAAYTVTATYTPSDTTTSSSSGTATINTPVAPTTISLVASPDSQLTYGTSVTYTATVAAQPTSTPLDGTVSIVDQPASGNAVTVCSDVPVGSDGTVSCGETPPAGTDAIAASYSGSATTAPSSSAGATELDVQPRAVVGSLTTPQTSPVAAGQPVTLQAAISASEGPVPTGGAVTFSVTADSKATTVCVTPLAAGVATCRWDPAPGSYTVTAAWSGDADDLPSGVITLAGQDDPYIVSAAASTTVLSPVTPSSLGASLPAGTAVTVGVTVTATGGGPTPTGSVTFYDDSQPIACGAVALQSGTAECTWTPTAGTTHTVTASYGGDADNGASPSNALAVTIQAAATATTLASAPDQPVFGQPDVLTATVTSGGTPVGDGTVAFAEDGTTIPGCAAVTVQAGTAGCQVEPSAGSHTFVASFNGGSVTAASASGPLGVDIGADPTTTAIAAAINTGGTTTLSATVRASTAGGAEPGSPTGTVSITVDGTSPPGCSDLALPPGSSSAAVVSCDWSAIGGGHTLAAVYTPSSDGSFVTSQDSEIYTPPATCSTGYAALWDSIVAAGGVSLANSAIGAQLEATASASGPCDPTRAVPFSVTGSLYDGSLGAVSVTGIISQDGGICFTAGALSLPAAWKIADPTISVPVCFAITAAGGLGAPTSGTLTSGTKSIPLPFVSLPEIPGSTVAVTFGPSTVTIDFVAGHATASAPGADLRVTIDGAGAYSGTLTTSNLSLFGQPLDLAGTISGSGRTVPTVTASASLGTVSLLAGLTLDGVVVTATNSGLTVTASAGLGATVPLTVAVTGTISSENTWSLALAGSGTTWKPIAGLAVDASFAGSITDTGGTLAYQLTAGTPGQEAVAWSPAAGVALTLTTVTLQSSATACDGSTISGSGDPLLTLAGTVALGSNQAALAGCVDLRTGGFQLGATADSGITVAPGFSIAGLALTLSGGGGHGATLTGTATATVDAGGKTVAAPVALEVTSTGSLTLAGAVDLTSLGIPVSGYVAYSSAPVTGFVIDPAHGTTIDLPAGVSAQGTYSPGAKVAALLGQAGFGLPSGGAITFLAALSPSAGATFDAELAGPTGLPFLTLPGGAALTDASLAWSGGTLQIVADATLPVPDVTQPATADITVTIDPSSGAFSGRGTLDGLSLFGQPVSLAGSITGTPDAATGKDTVSSEISGTIAGPFSPTGVSELTISDLSVILGTGGLQLAGTLGAANLGSLSLQGSLTSLSNWSIAVAGSAQSWQPDPSLSIDGSVSGTLTDRAGVLTYDVEALPGVAGGDVATFVPSTGVSLGVTGVELSDGSTLPAGCSIAKRGDNWLAISGDLSASFSGHGLSATATGCFDLTARTFGLTASLDGSISAAGGDVAVSSPTITITRSSSGFSVAGTAALTVDMPTGGTFTAHLSLDYEGSGNFVVGSEVDLSQWLGSVGAIGYLYYSSSAVSAFQTGDPTLGAIALPAGVSFALDVSLPESADTTLSTLGIATPTGTIGAIGTINFASSVYSLELEFNAGINGQTLFTTSSGASLVLERGFLQLSIGGDQVSFSLGLQADLDLPAVDPGDSGSVVPLTGALTFSDTEVDASLSVGTCGDPADAWQNAFGIDGLSVECATVQGGLSLEGIPLPSFGFSGSIDGLPSSVSNAIGYVNNAPIDFAFNLDPLLLSLSIGTENSGTPALEPFAAFGQGSLAQVDYASLYVSPTGATVGTTVYPAGFGLGFQAILDGVSVNILAQLDPNTPSLSFTADISKITIGALTIGPVSVDLEASPSSFNFDLDASLTLGPGTVDIGPALQVSGAFTGSISVSLGSSGLTAYVSGSANVTFDANIAQETCYEYGIFPYPCDFQWESTSYAYTLAQTGVAVTASGLTLYYDGDSVTLPWPSASNFAEPASQRVGHVTATSASGGTGRSSAAPQPGTWGASPSEPTATAFAATATLPDGAVLVAGGGNSSGALAGASLRNPQTGAWKRIASMHQGRVGATATVLADGRVLVAGGRDSDGPLARAEIYDPSTGQWTETGPMVAATAYGTATLLPDGSVLVAGGYAAKGPTAVAEIYDPATGSWAAAAPMSAPRALQTATALDGGAVLVAGGEGNAGPQASAEIYDPTTATWSATAPMHFVRFGASAVKLDNGSVFVTGDAGHAEIFRPSSGTWEISAAEPEARILAGAALLPDGRVLVAGGLVSAAPRKAAKPVATAEIFDPVTGLLGPVADLPTSGAGSSVSVLPDGDVLVAGGLASRQQAQPDAAVFDPAPPAALPWPSSVSSGEPAVKSGSPSGFYVGESNDHWNLVVTHTGRANVLYTATITINRGTFTDVSGFRLEKPDRYTAKGGTIILSFRDHGGLDGLSFVTPRAATTMTLHLEIDGVQATAGQVLLGSDRTQPDISNPVTLTRIGAGGPVGVVG